MSETPRRYSAEELRQLAEADLPIAEAFDVDEREHAKAIRRAISQAAEDGSRLEQIGKWADEMRVSEHLQPKQFTAIQILDELQELLIAAGRREETEGR